jgi:F-type H+-transporting ATPase subunit gamma
MLTLDQLQRRIKTSHDLLSVVKTMKSLAAVNIRQYEAAAAALDEYYGVVEKGWQALFRDFAHLPAGRQSGIAVCLVVGSDQGMCGQFNEAVLEDALQYGEELQAQGLRLRYWTAGERLRAGLEENHRVEQHFPLPGSLSGISDRMHRIVTVFGEWQRDKLADSLFILYNRLKERGSYQTVRTRLLPLDRQWLAERHSTPWPTRCLPMLGLSRDSLFDHLFSQYLFASFYRAFAQSMASENAARLASMQAAEKNILDMEEELGARYRETRQSMITAELLDIVSGFEAVMGDE